jgi:hypothetical protein
LHLFDLNGCQLVETGKDYTGKIINGDAPPGIGTPSYFDSNQKCGQSASQRWRIPYHGRPSVHGFNSIGDTKVIITIEKAAKANGNILVDVVLEFPNGDRNLTQLSLIKDGRKSDGDPARHVWRIAKFIDRKRTINISSIWR